MARTASFHDDPSTTECAECTEPDCTADHFALQVRGAHTVEQFQCKHLVNVVHWHDLTPVTEPDPVCDQGCTLTRTVIG